MSYQWQKDEVGGRRQVTSGDNLATGGKYNEYEFGGVQVEPSEREVNLTALEMELGLGFATLTSSTSYYDHTGEGISDNSGVYARNGWFVFYGLSPRPMAQAERFTRLGVRAGVPPRLEGRPVRRLDGGAVLTPTRTTTSARTATSSAACRT